jgi:tetratricopeptide (TPR) repeat protein
MMKVWMVVLLLGGWILAGDPKMPDPQVSDLEALLKEQPNDSETMLTLVKLLNQQGQGEAAFTWAEKLVKLTPNSAEAHAALGTSLRLKMGQNPMAWMMGKSQYLGALEQAITLNPQFVAPYLELMGFYRNAPAIAGGSMKKAHEVVDRLTLVAPLDGGLARGSLWYKEGNQQKSLDTYLALLKDFPEEPQVWYRIGLAQSGLNNYPEAAAAFKNVLEKESRWQTQALYQLGKTYLLWGQQLEEALDLFARYLQAVSPEDHPAPADALWRKGQVHLALAQKDQAKICFQQALALDGDHKESKKELSQL